MVHLIDMGILHSLLPFLGQRSPAYAIHRPGIILLAAGIHRAEGHAVGMKGQEDVSIPGEGGPVLAQDTVDGPVGTVPMAGGCKASVECDVEGGRLGVPLKIDFRRVARPHSVTATGAVSYPVEFAQCDHTLSFLPVTCICHPEETPYAPLPRSFSRMASH